MAATYRLVVSSVTLYSSVVVDQRSQQVVHYCDGPCHLLCKGLECSVTHYSLSSEPLRLQQQVREISKGSFIHTPVTLKNITGETINLAKGKVKEISMDHVPCKRRSKIRTEPRGWRFTDVDPSCFWHYNGSDKTYPPRSHLQMSLDEEPCKLNGINSTEWSTNSTLPYLYPTGWTDLLVKTVEKTETGCNASDEDIRACLNILLKCSDDLKKCADIIKQCIGRKFNGSIDGILVDDISSAEIYQTMIARLSKYLNVSYEGESGPLEQLECRDVVELLSSLQALWRSPLPGIYENDLPPRYEDVVQSVPSQKPLPYVQREENYKETEKKQVYHDPYFLGSPLQTASSTHSNNFYSTSLELSNNNSNNMEMPLFFDKEKNETKFQPLSPDESGGKEECSLPKLDSKRQWLQMQVETDIHRQIAETLTAGQNPLDTCKNGNDLDKMLSDLELLSCSTAESPHLRSFVQQPDSSFCQGGYPTHIESLQKSHTSFTGGLEGDDVALLQRILENIEEYAQELSEGGVSARSKSSTLAQEQEVIRLLQDTLVTATKAMNTSGSAYPSIDTDCESFVFCNPSSDIKEMQSKQDEEQEYPPPALSCPFKPKFHNPYYPLSPIETPDMLTSLSCHIADTACSYIQTTLSSLSTDHVQPLIPGQDTTLSSSKSTILTCSPVSAACPRPQLIPATQSQKTPCRTDAFCQTGGPGSTSSFSSTSITSPHLCPHSVIVTSFQPAITMTLSSVITPSKTILSPITSPSLPLCTSTKLSPTTTSILFPFTPSSLAQPTIVSATNNCLGTPAGLHVGTTASISVTIVPNTTPATTNCPSVLFPEESPSTSDSFALPNPFKHICGACSAEELNKTVEGIEAAFTDLEKQRATMREMGMIAKACGFPLYWKAALFHSAGGQSCGYVSAHSLLDTWKKLSQCRYDDPSKFVLLLGKSDSTYLVQDDFNELLQDIVDTHPGLTFLKDAPEFHTRYIATVIQRIFYTVNRSWTGRITVSELRKSNFLQTLARLEKEDDINQVTDYFSYEHFYVIYCKFWELDLDHDLLIYQRDLRRYNYHACSSRIIQQVFSGAVTRGQQSQKKENMTYAEFVWFLISEEDKKSPTSVEYWFRCMDMDGDGVLSMYELEYFYEEQQERLEALGVEALPFCDLLCQMLDLIQPQQPGKITLWDLKKCGMAHLFYDTFFSLEKYLEHEQREPLPVQRAADSRSAELSDWDRFAAEEYQVLVAEESESEQPHERMSEGGSESNAETLQTGCEKEDLVAPEPSV